MRSPLGKNHLANLFPRPPKIREYVAESLTTLYGFRPSHVSFQSCALCAWVINPSEKHSFRNMQRCPRTRLVRGISCSPNFPRTSIPRFTYAKHGPILYYNIACVLTLYKSYWATMNKIFTFARPCVIKMTWAFFLPGFRVSVLLSCGAVLLLFL